MILPHKCPPDRPLHEYRSELTVCGYSRRHSVETVPASLVNIMLKFYNLWIRRHFTEDEVAKWVDNIIVNGTKLRVDFRVLYESYHSHREHFQLFLRIAVPSNIRFISCITVDHSSWLAQRKWVRLYAENDQEEEHSDTHNHDIMNLGRSYRVTTYNLCEKLWHPISFYVDIKQIKYWTNSPLDEPHHLDFDESATLEIRKRQWKWDIQKRSLAELRSNQSDQWSINWNCTESSSDKQWTFHVYCVDKKYRLIVAHPGSFSLPLNVSSLDIMMTVSSYAESRYFEKQKVVSMKGGCIREEVNLKWKTRTIMNERSVDLKIEMEPIKAFDLDQNEIVKADWTKYGIILCDAIVERLGIHAKVDEDLVLMSDFDINGDRLRRGLRQMQTRAMLNQIFQSVTTDWIAEDVLEEQITHRIESLMMMRAKSNSILRNGKAMSISEEAKQRIWRISEIKAGRVKDEMERGFLSNAYDIEIGDTEFRRYKMKTVNTAVDKTMSAMKALFATMPDLHEEWQT